MRIVMLTQSYLPLPGGAERQIAALVPLLAKRGMEVTVLTRRWTSDLAEEEEIGGAQVIRLPVPGPKPLASLSYTLAAMPVIRRLRPAVLHAHELLSPTTTALVARRQLGIPVVAKVLRGGRLGDIDKLKHRPFGAGRLRSIRSGVDRFIVISSEIDRELEALGVPADQRVRIPNGVDGQRFRPAEDGEKAPIRARLGLPENALVAVYSGRLTPEKNVDRLLDLWPAVRQNEPRALLLVLGAGPEETRLRARAGQGVVFAGQVEHVPEALRAADLFVLPSSTEGLSNALLEAMASGLACVVTDVGGARDLIAAGENGWPVPNGKNDELRIAIQALLANDAQRKSLGNAARARVLREYSLTATADRLAELYKAVADEERGQ